MEPSLEEQPKPTPKPSAFKDFFRRLFSPRSWRWKQRSSTPPDAADSCPMPARSSNTGSKIPPDFTFPLPSPIDTGASTIASPTSTTFEVVTADPIRLPSVQGPAPPRIGVLDSLQVWIKTAFQPSVTSSFVPNPGFVGALNVFS
ncbi:hypothetical protein DXG03_006807 [Asterophora parasitica]|uniref:Uncharacterized protein n=1 Tax=Asterophora parasitica TaxID=117018 RepID=A0A9P7K9E5_9AGAR|nr:hypothetical protein DXG03_006807 [Asterophora parasitica]